MPYITESKLRSFSTIALANERPISTRSVTLAGFEITVFLSHSHEDRHLINPAIGFLEQLGVRIYVDWLDSEMPKEISGDTAKKLKSKIEQHKKFIMLASSNAKDSKWIPWELGYADRTKGIRNIAVLPISQGEWNFDGTEYVRIYPIIKEYEGQYVVSCDEPNMWKDVKDWLQEG